MRLATVRIAMLLAAAICARCDGAHPPIDSGEATDATLDVEASRDVGVQADAGAPCFATDGYSPRAFIPPHAATNACTFDEIEGYFTQCLDQPGATPIHCQQFTTAHMACSQCILPAAATHESGAIRTVSGTLDVNVGGCIALLLADTTANGCGAREEAAIECERAACEPCEGDPTCAARARESVCRDVAVQRCPELAGASVCTLDRTFGERFRAIAQVFCAAPDR